MTLTHSMMNEYLRRMSSTGLKAYIRSGILLYDTWDSMGSDEVAKLTVHAQYLPGFLSFQKSVEDSRFLFQLTRLLQAKETLIIQRVAHFLSMVAVSGMPQIVPMMGVEALRRQVLVSDIVESLITVSSNSTFDAQLLLDVITLIEVLSVNSACGGGV